MKNPHRIDHTPFIVDPHTKVRLADYETDFTAGFENKQAAEQALLEDVSELAAAQALLWASKEHAVIIIFQALDAAGKDGTIKHVMSGVNPQGVGVFSFKAPTEEELLHHYLWRPMRVLPARGMIAIFNRSYYEEVLVVRVHPELLEKQWLPEKLRGDLSLVWKTRFHEINRFEETLSEQNITVIKFFLHISKEEQRERFLERLDDTKKNWKFSMGDLREREFWDEYQSAYEKMLTATSTKRSPWYIIPADKKWFARACVADIVTSRISELDLTYPTISESERAALEEARKKLERKEG